MTSLHRDIWMRGSLPVPFVSRRKTDAVKAEATHNHAEGASMSQEVIVYSNVGCDPCHQAMESLSQQGVPLPMMSMTKYLFLGALLLGLVSGVVACASTALGDVRVPRSYDETFVAVLASVQEAAVVVT